MWCSLYLPLIHQTSVCLDHFRASNDADKKEMLQKQRAEYGRQVVDTIAARLTAEFGNKFGRRNLLRMIQFAEQFPEEQIVSTLSAQLPWSQLLEILLVKDELARQFYVERCRLERWSVRTRHDKINRSPHGPQTRAGDARPRAP